MTYSYSYCSTSLHRESSCGYFQWADEVPAVGITPGAAGGAGIGRAGGAAQSNACSGSKYQGNQQHKHQQPHAQYSSGESSARQAPVRYLGTGTPRTGAAADVAAGISSECVCHCGTPAITQVTRKEGPNLGRQFFVCRKPR